MDSPCRRFQTLLVIGTLALSTAGCASHKTSTVSVTREEVPSASSTGGPSHIVTETKETTTENNNSCGGIISCTAEGVGFLLALPFRLIGGVIDVIF